jgi:hypothetical protein
MDMTLPNKEKQATCSNFSLRLLTSAEDKEEIKDVSKKKSGVGDGLKC